TCVQLELLADTAGRGEHLEAIVDPADPDARPAPRPDLRRMLVPIGPVAVFGASNFPLAFGVAGGDAASALAAGCPVLVKGHPCHPGTGELVAAELAAALAQAGLPAGTFAHLLSAGHEVGVALVEHPDVRAVAFTGSRRGGRALMDRAAARPAPIPVFAEMGSLNPLVVTEAALDARGEAIAEGLVASVCTFGGQLCTKPGIVFVPATDAGDAFAAELAGAFEQREPEVMLSGAIRDAFAAGIARAAALEGAELVAGAAAGDEPPGFRSRPVVLRTWADRIGAPGMDALAEEHFGPGVVLARYGAPGEVVAALERLGGQLTGTLHAQPGEPGARELWDALTRVAGRVVFDGFPTGVSVTWAMQHGGPYPSSSDGAHTSVGPTAMRRFLRPVALQSAPAELLPAALRDGNPLGLARREDGVLRP
ncbi:MAG TPA: aldehyde dehydrogenase family protein, partial [Solirubrobacteraceae bacterium]|nr:aldehyde dehydrogenase family protein [Solirubrobacteraceae bacterium]